MVQEIAKKLIRMGEKGRRSSDLYFIPRKEEYQVFMRVGDEALCAVLPFEEMTAIISHFKFVAGMNVGEKGAAS